MNWTHPEDSRPKQQATPNFLTKRLINFESPNYTRRNKETLFDYFKKNPIETVAFLEKNIVIEDEICTVKEAALDFNFNNFLEYKGIKIVDLISWRDGMVFTYKRVE